MKSMNHLQLAQHEREALAVLKAEIGAVYPGAQIILFGSKAKGMDGEWSDIDLLIVLNDLLDGQVRETIETIKYNIELKYDIIIGLIIKSKTFWDSSLAKAMPLHWAIDHDGIYL